MSSTQPIRFPFPLPILTFVGFLVIGRFARTLTHILAFHAASMAQYERRLIHPFHVSN